MLKRVNGEGSAGPKILVVGEAPGADEEAEGRPFIGPSGQLLNRLLKQAGVKRDETYVTNVYKF